MRAATEHRLALRNITLAARSWGDPALPPLLAVHGWLDNAASFDRLAPALVDHHVVAIDLAGHGRSAHRGNGNWYAYVDYLDEIAEVIAHFGWSRVDLLGHSLGATLASVYAAVHPQQVGQLLLVEGLGPLSSPAEKTFESLQRALLARAKFNVERLRVFASIEAAVEARCRSGAISADAARGIVERGLNVVDSPRAGAESTGYRWSSDPRLTLPSAWRLTELQIAPIIEAIRCRTLLILAEPAAPYLDSALIDARIVGVADIEVVRMAGSHHLHIEHADAVAAIMLAFLHNGNARQ